MAAPPGALPSFTMVNSMVSSMTCAWYLNLTHGKKAKEHHEGWHLGLAPMGTRTEDNLKHLTHSRCSMKGVAALVRGWGDTVSRTLLAWGLPGQAPGQRARGHSQETGREDSTGCGRGAEIRRRAAGLDGRAQSGHTPGGSSTHPGSPPHRR